MQINTVLMHYRVLGATNFLFFFSLSDFLPPAEAGQAAAAVQFQHAPVEILRGRCGEVGEVERRHLAQRPAGHG